MTTETTQPWLDGVHGTQVIPLICSDAQLIRVEAGPGTGKTFGLVRRVQRIVHPSGLGVPGDEVLIVAFNRVIAKQLRTDVVEMLTHSDSDGTPVIRTIHALCLQAIGGAIRLLLPHEREAMLYDVLETHPDLRTEFITFRAVEQALSDHEAKHAEHMYLWQATQEWLVRHNANLIGDLPGMLLDQLKMGDIGTKAYEHVVVDEFQDLTPGEQVLVVRMMAPGGCLVALGDPLQSIYKFRGNDRDGLANLEILLGVDSSEISDIDMAECQRCPGDIVTAANQLMRLQSTKPMVPDMTRHGNTHVVVWDTPQKEAAGMAKAIVANRTASPESERHLVMVTRRQFGYMLRDEIAKLNPDLYVDLSFSEGLLETWAVREAFLMFCLLTDPDPATWRAWLGYENSVNGKGWKAPSRNSPAYLFALSTFGDTVNENAMRQIADGGVQLKGAGRKIMKERASRFVALKESLGNIGDDAVEFVTSFFDTTRWAGAGTLDLSTVLSDMELVKQKCLNLLADLQDFDDAPDDPAEQLCSVAKHLRYDIAVREPSSPDGKVDIQITTLWSSKGVTAEHVYVIGITGETLPGEKRDEYPGTTAQYVAEQRRLFYVSITRSKKTMVLSRARRIRRSEALSLGLSDLPGGPFYGNFSMSPFLRDIVQYLPQAESGDGWTGCVT